MKKTRKCILSAFMCGQWTRPLRTPNQSYCLKALWARVSMQWIHHAFLRHFLALIPSHLPIAILPLFSQPNPPTCNGVCYIVSGDILPTCLYAITFIFFRSPCSRCFRGAFETRRPAVIGDQYSWGAGRGPYRGHCVIILFWSDALVAFPTLCTVIVGGTI